MEFSYPEESKSSSSEETDRSEQNDHDTGTGSGRSYECVFCKRGFTTAQALGGHMNIHRKDRAKTKPIHFPAPSTSTKLIDHDNNYTRLGFYSAIPTHPGSYYSTAPEVDSNNYRPIYFAAPSNMRYGEVFCVQNQRDRDPYEQDQWRKSLSLYSNHPLCIRENKDKAEDNTEEDGLDLELRLGHHP